MCLLLLFFLRCYSIIFMLGITGNVLVILTILQNTRMRTVTNLFLLNLAISDLLLGVFCMPFTLIGQLLRDFIFGEVFCKLISFFQGMNSFPLFSLLIVQLLKTANRFRCS